MIEEQTTETNSERILIVDDEESVRRLYATYLGEHYQCITAADAQEALLKLADGDFALVIADVQMPGLSGIELLRRIVKHFPDTAVIIASGIERSQRVLDALRLGAYDYLIKPCELGVLQLSVERALEKRALLRDARRYKQELESRNAELLRRQEELARLQAQIVHSEKMASLGQLAAGVAHELNNPAGFIYGNMEMLAQCVAGLERLLKIYDRAEPPQELSGEVAAVKREINYETTLEDIRSIVEDCRDGAERIRDVVQNLRLFSRLDEADFKKVDLHEGLDSTIRLLSQYYGPNRIPLERDYGKLPLVDCYAGQLNQVWMNLLQNAAQAAGPGGKVRVATHLEGRMAVVTVSDTGRGIPPEHMEKIFDPFFTTKGVGEGTGLGLSISYGIVKRHGGFINVESNPGEGTSFAVAIPVDAKGDEKAGVK
ncbi:MAG: ATP-binding protein [Acidobacteriota bacterium]|nr:ATP-binding protein [Acidobacteriota bacterium]